MISYRISWRNTSSLRSRRIKGRGQGRRKRIRTKKRRVREGGGGVPFPPPSLRFFSFSPPLPPPLYTPATQAKTQVNRIKIKERPRSGNDRRPHQCLFRFKEVKRKTGLSELWNVTHKEEKAMLEHTIRLHTSKTIYFKLNLSAFTCTDIFKFYRLSQYILSCQFLFSSLENDDMESSKRCVKLFSLIFIIRFFNYFF